MATKSDITEKLDELEIEYDPRAKKDDLWDLLPEEAQEELEGDDEGDDEGDEGDEGDAPAAADVKVTKGVTRPGKSDEAVDIVLPDGSWEPNVSRTYSAKEHGKNFMKLAESYVRARKAKHNQDVVIAKHRSR